MAMNYTTPVRKSLRDRGISDSRIGYTGGQVTIDNKPFMTPNKTYSGSAFSSPTSFNTAWNDYTKRQQAPGTIYNMGPRGQGAGDMSQYRQYTPQQNTQQQYSPYGNQSQGMGAVAGAGNMAANTPYQQPTPSYQQQPAPTGYFDQYNQMAQQPIDVYNTPQYQAYAAQSARRQQEGIRASQEALGSAGFGRSTALGERAGRIAGQEQEYLQTQVMPQLYAQEEARRQQAFANAMAMQEADRSYGFQQEQLGLQRGQLTGTLYSQQEQAAQPLLNQLTALGEAWRTGTPEQQAQYGAQATQIRNQLSQMGLDPSLYDPSLSTEQRREAVGGLGTQTQAGREFEQQMAQQQAQMAYQQARDKIADSRYKTEFDEDKRRFGLEFALDKAVKNRQLSQDDARISLARASESRQAASASRSEGKQNLGLLFDIWENTGIAPAGIPGVEAGTPIYEKPTAAQKKTEAFGPEEAPKVDAKTSVDNYDYYLSELENAKELTTAEANKYIEGERAFLSDTDYRALKKWIKDNPDYFTK